VALFSGIAGMAGFFAFVAIYSIEHLRFDGASGVLFLFGGVVVITRVVFARLPDRVPPFRLATVALTLCGAGLLLVSTLGTVAGLVAGAMVLAVGVAFTTPALFTAIFAAVDPSQRGAASGTASLFLDLAFGGGPMVLGLVAGGAGIPAAFAVAAGVAIAGAVGSGVAASRQRRDRRTGYVAVSAESP
jgi:predicted MFS family arabinose efflux permease